MLTTLLAGALQATSAAEPTAPACPTEIVNPDWAQLPSREDASKLYPDDASRLGYAGEAKVLCLVQSDGRLTACKVLGEEPEDRGFGEAALKLTAKFLMKPQTKDGQSVAGRAVRVPVRFIYPGQRLAPLQATHAKLKDGHAELNCRVSRGLILDNCFLEGLQPRDDLLRDTAMRLAVRFKAPQGTPSGTRVVLPIDFRPGAAPLPTPGQP